MVTDLGVVRLFKNDTEEGGGGCEAECPRVAFLPLVPSAACRSMRVDTNKTPGTERFGLAGNHARF